MHFASLSNRHIEMNQLLINGYFNDGLALYDSEQLVSLATQLGLDGAAAKGGH